MPIRLPAELENPIRSLVACRVFTSDEEVVTKAIRSFLKSSLFAPQESNNGGVIQHASFIGSMNDAADELDEIVADAHRFKQSGPVTEEAFKRQLLKFGLITSLPIPDDPATRPVLIEGEPLSETIIRERR